MDKSNKLSNIKQIKDFHAEIRYIDSIYLSSRNIYEFFMEIETYVQNSNYIIRKSDSEVQKLNQHIKYLLSYSKNNPKNKMSYQDIVKLNKESYDSKKNLTYLEVLKNGLARYIDMKDSVFFIISLTIILLINIVMFIEISSLDNIVFEIIAKFALIGIMLYIGLVILQIDVKFLNLVFVEKLKNILGIFSAVVFSKKTLRLQEMNIKEMNNYISLIYTNQII